MFEQNATSSAAWLGKGIEFHEGGGAVTVRLLPTRAARTRMALIELNATTSSAISSIDVPVQYEEAPEAYEATIRRELCDRAIEFLHAFGYARAAGAVLIQVKKMPVSERVVPTPTDGRVNEVKVREHIKALIATSTALGQVGHGYASENGGKLLRAVAPVKEVGDAPNSQGFGDLRCHCDNADRQMFGLPDCHPGGGGPMNAWQLFIAVAPKLPSMEVLSVADAVDGVSRRYGAAVVDLLQRPEFAVMRPHSHGGGLGVSGVPVLVRGPDASWHSRFHATAVIGMTPEAESALEKLRAEIEGTDAVNVIEAERGSTISYSNTQCLHRRQPYAPRFDGRDRFFLRLYGVPSEALVACESFRQGRIFT